jgi:hypothetical protein
MEPNAWNTLTFLSFIRLFYASRLSVAIPNPIRFGLRA